MTDSQTQNTDKGPMLGSYPGITLRDYDLDTTGLSDVSFGRDMRREFGFRQGFISFNHGSFGTVPNRVLEMQYKYNKEREEEPDMFYRIKARMYVDRTRKEIASRINAKIDNVVLAENATTAVNCAVRNFPFMDGDAILVTNHTYGSIRYLCKEFTSHIKQGVERVNLTLNFPIKSEDEVIESYKDILEKHPNIKLAIIDHITSPSSLVMPVTRLCQLLHSRGVTVIVDGAHAFGQIPLDMEAVGGDIYTSNLHKWCYSPRGTALLWFSDKFQEWLRPPNVSWQKSESLDLQFFDQGTRDHVPFICGQHAIQFYDAIGGMDKIVNYTRELADECKRLLQEIGFEPLAIPLSMEAPNMRVFKLPPLPKFPFSPKDTMALNRAVFGGSNLFALIAPLADFWVMRISTQIYNDMEEVKMLVEHVGSFIDKNKV